MCMYVHTHVDICIYSHTRTQTHTHTHTGGMFTQAHPGGAGGGKWHGPGLGGSVGDSGPLLAQMQGANTSSSMPLNVILPILWQDRALTPRVEIVKCQSTTPLLSEMTTARMGCNTMQRTATHCNTLQYSAIHCNITTHADF